jgi:putative spermidine/putrescine transport system ATP-binding protein
VRPEKIRVMLGSPAPEAHERAAAGVIHEVVYVGMATRFIVDLDAGGSLIAVQQNSHATSSEVNSMRGQRVTLMWNTEHEVAVGD